MGTAIDARATDATRHRYDRLARVYDRMEAGAERRFAPWRAARMNHAQLNTTFPEVQ